MAWITPKTNWVATDYFNATDYNRIVGNILFLKEIGESMYGKIETESMEKTKTYTSMFFAEEMNKIERNLDTINEATFNLEIGESESYSANGATPLWSEFNRIESALFNLFKWLEGQKMMLPFLAIGLGKKQFGKRVHYSPEEQITLRSSFRLGNVKGVFR